MIWPAFNGMGRRNMEQRCSSCLVGQCSNFSNGVDGIPSMNCVHLLGAYSTRCNSLMLWPPTTISQDMLNGTSFQSTTFGLNIHSEEA